METSRQSPECIHHPSKKVIAVCLTPGCQTNLCDSCFADHSMHHTQLGTHMQLTSLDDLRIQARNKLAETIDEAKTRKASFDLFANSSGPEALKKKINNVRSSVVQATMDYFDELEKKISVMTLDSTKSRENQVELFDREINRFIQNLHNMADNLNVKSSMIKTMLHVKQKDLRNELDLIHEKCSLPPDTAILDKNPSLESALMQWFNANIRLIKIDPPKKKIDPNQVDIESEEFESSPTKVNDDIEKYSKKETNDDASQQENDDSNKIHLKF